MTPSRSWQLALPWGKVVHSSKMLRSEFCFS